MLLPRPRSRSQIRAGAVTVLALIAMVTIAAAPTTAAQAPIVVASAITDVAPVNLTSFTNSAPLPFSSPGDGFDEYQRGVSPSIPFGLADDSDSIFTGDSLGILTESDPAPMFGVIDTVNGDTAGPVVATWVFDVSSAASLSVAIDAAAMGDFETTDVIGWTYSIDGAPAMPLFDLAVDEADSRTYTLSDGDMFTLDDPMNVGTVQLTNEFATIVTALPTSGAALTLALSAEVDGGSEAIAFRNIVVSSTAPPAPPTDVHIHDIQGSGSAAPDVGQIVSVEAIVVGDYQDVDQLQGFFLQEEDVDIDADPTTSEGIFVFCDACAVDVNEGDRVEVTGEIEERFGMTQLDAAAGGVDIAAVSSGLPTPAQISLPVVGDVDTFYEQFEGMLVEFTDTLVVSEYFQLARFGQIVLYPGARPFQYTQTDDTPTMAEYQAHLADLAAHRVILDDDNNDQNSPLPAGTIFHPQPGGFGVGAQGVDFFRGGDELTSLIGVLHWSWAGASGTDAWRIRPIDAAPAAFAATNARPAAAPDVGGSLTVAAFNVLSYFSTIDAGAGICGPLADQGCRGADSADELTRQTDKLAAAITAMDADIVGLVELENNASGSLDAIVAALPGYDYVNAGTIGADAIKVGLIHRTATVTPLGAHAILDDSVDPTFVQTENRPVLAQAYTEIATGEVLTVAVNHLKSKGSDCDALGDPNLNDGQGNCNLTRTAAATALATWLAADPTGSGSPDNLIIGDLNAYAGEDPITALRNAGYVDVVAQGGVSDHSFVFDGQLGTLDYAMASPSIVAKVTGAASWAINADEVNVFDYNDTIVDASEASFEAKPSGNPLYAPDVFRSSDHDPVLVGLDLMGGGLCNGQTVTVNLSLGQMPTANDDVILGTIGDDVIAAGAGNDIVCGLAGNDTIWGQDGDDQIFGGTGDDKLRGGNDNDMVWGEDGSDDLSGGRGDDTVDGGAGNDMRVRGGTGVDIVSGGDGNDVLVAGNGGEDTVSGGSGTDKVTGGPRPDMLWGGDGDDLVKGNGGADTIDAGAGDDSVFGGPQPDTIDGGAGTDWCNGGTTGSGAPESDTAVGCETVTNVP